MFHFGLRPHQASSDTEKTKDYRVEYSKRQRVSLSVTPEGELLVKAPKHVSTRLIDQFVKDNQGWVERHRSKATRGSTRPFLVFGQPKSIVVTHSPEQPWGVRIDGDGKVCVNLLNHAPDRADTPTTGLSTDPPFSTITQYRQLPTAAKTQLDRFLKTSVNHYLAHRCADLAPQMGLTYKTLNIRQQTSRWGSCSNRSSLQFNWRLIHAPIPVIDYVIIHELAHLKHMNHSRAFWEFVRQFDKDFAAHRAWLHKEGRWFIQ